MTGLRPSSMAIRRPVTTGMAFLGLGLVGFLSFRRLPVQLLPDYSAPQAFVQVVYPGASPDGVERDVLRRLEGELGTLSGIESLASTARTGGGTIVVSFNRDVDLDMSTLRVQQRLAAVKESLPDQVQLGVDRFDSSALSNF